MTFGTLPPINAIGWDDIFLVKYDASGNEQWAVIAGGGANDYGYDLVADNIGGVYLTGSFEGSCNFGTLTSGGLEDVFVAKLDAAGNFLWAKKGGSTMTDAGRAVVVDGAGNVFITGYIAGTSTFNTTTINNTSGSVDIFVAKYDASGNLGWAIGDGGNGNDKAFGICRDNQGGLYVSGSFELIGVFGSNTISAQGFSDVFTAKYDPANGTNIWAMPGGAEDEDVSHGIGIDASENLYIAGYFRTQAFFGTQLTANVYDEVFVVKITNPLSVNDIEANSIHVTVYPNPSSSIVNVNVSEGFFTNKSHYEITDVTGKLISTEKLSSENSKIDFSLLPKGIYMLKIVTENG